MEQSISVWIGLDVGKADHHATVVDAEGQIVFDRAVRNDQSAIERLLDAAGDQAALVIDQPGSIGALAVAVARRRGIPVAYVPGLVMRRASELYPGEAKTDRRDSFVIADTARIHRARVHWLAEGEDVLEQLRVLGGYDDDLAHDRTRAANRLRDMLLQASPAVERVLGDRLEHPAVRALLQRYPTPSAMRAAGPRRMLRIVTPRAPRMGQRLIDELQAALAAQTVVVPAEATIGRVISDLAVELGRLAAAREKLAGEIESVFASHPQAPVLLSIPGIGARTGARILTEIGDVSRFPTAGHLAAYAGLAPVTKQSGRTLNGEHRSRRGNHRLKNALWLSAFCSLHHPPARDYYARKRAQGKKHNAAILCLARRRCDLIHKMLTTGQSYGEPPARPAEPLPEPVAA
ncbi:MAG TPA: IS110 family transposase [Solirubrobacteraceae bacterium]|nr:IS110 family transposase [Solirubrobacteraceae bacterium]